VKRAPSHSPESSEAALDNTNMPCTITRALAAGPLRMYPKPLSLHLKPWAQHLDWCPNLMALVCDRRWGFGKVGRNPNRKPSTLNPKPRVATHPSAARRRTTQRPAGHATRRCRRGSPCLPLSL